MTFKEKYQQLSRSGLSMDEWVRAFGQFVWDNAVSVRVIAEDDEGNIVVVDNPYIRVNFDDLGENIRLEYEDEFEG